LRPPRAPRRHLAPRAARHVDVHAVFPCRWPDAGTLEKQAAHAERCIDIMTGYAPNFRRSVLHYQVLARI
jgi:hypothetical protein